MAASRNQYDIHVPGQGQIHLLTYGRSQAGHLPHLGRGRVIIETLGRGDVIGLSWLLPPYQWRFGAVTTAPLQAFELDGREVREACAADLALGYELNRRFIAVLVHRLQATRNRLLEACAHPELIP